MNQPKNQKAAILYKLIVQDGLSERDTNYNGFRARISELNELISISYESKPFVSEFGHKNCYRWHYLRPMQKLEAMRIYKEINK